MTKEKIMELGNLIEDIIETLDGRDDSVNSWIEERLEDVDQSDF